MIFWITGRPGAGKTTLAKKIARQINAVTLDGDLVRADTGNNDFSYEGIEQNLTVITEKAIEWDQNHKNVVIACVSPYKKMRKACQKRLRGSIEIQLPGGYMREGTKYEE